MRRGNGWKCIYGDNAVCVLGKFGMDAFDSATIIFQQYPDFIHMQVMAGESESPVFKRIYLGLTGDKTIEILDTNHGTFEVNKISIDVQTGFMLFHIGCSKNDALVGLRSNDGLVRLMDGKITPSDAKTQFDEYKALYRDLELLHERECFKGIRSRKLAFDA